MNDNWKAIHYDKSYGELIVVINIEKKDIDEFVDLIVEDWNIDNKITGKILDDVKYEYTDDRLNIYLKISEE